jgi:methenyltetrahydromethanopterin cyclohydrolase
MKGSSISVNRGAVRVVERMIQDKEKLGVDVFELPNGAKVVDAGVNASGGLMAGKYFSEACLGGLGEVSFTMGERLLVHVQVDHPAIACMGSQFAGWIIKVEDYFAMGSGPARARARQEKLFDEIGYKDDFEEAVIALETRKLPDEKVADFISQKCGVSPKGLYILVAPTASIVGGVQISARVVETGVHKLHEVGFDIRKIISGSGSAPVAPVAKNDLEAMGKTNDCILYGGRTKYFVSAEDSEIEKVIASVPSSSSRDYGAPFLEVFEKYNGDFYKVDPKLFSPAEVTINNIKTGKIFHAGNVNEGVLKKSLGV